MKSMYRRQFALMAGMVLLSFLMLGAAAPNDVMDDEAASLTFYQQQNDIAVKAIDGVLGA